MFAERRHLLLSLLVLVAFATLAASGPGLAAEDGGLDAIIDTTEQGEPERSEPPAAGESTAATTARGERERRSVRERPRLGDRRLRIGLRGRDVRRLQNVLGELNFPTAVDGVFGRATERSVRRYERWKEKGVDAVVTRKQARRMKERVARGVFYRKHVFPVRGPHNYGGSGSRFGAPRGGRSHMGQDVAAAEGTPLVAVHEGRVMTRQFQAGGAGHYLVIRGRDGSDSVYMHLREPAIVAPGEHVLAGQPIGRVGTTGSSSGPHLHFELWTPHWFAGGEPYDPLAKLLKWDRRS